VGKKKNEVVTSFSWRRGGGEKRGLGTGGLRRHFSGNRSTNSSGPNKLFQNGGGEKEKTIQSSMMGTREGDMEKEIKN